MTPDQLTHPGDRDPGRPGAIVVVIYYRDHRGVWSDVEPPPRDIDLSWMRPQPAHRQEVAS